jgi:methionyl-tRNA formyltransferase
MQRNTKLVNKKLKLNVILCGFQWSGCKALNELIKNKKINKIFVYTHKAPHYFSDLVNLCHKNNISFTTEKISLENLKFKPDLILSISYRYKIPSNVIMLSKNKAINLHPSILPNYKGCSSVTWAMINKEKYTGYTYHFMNDKYDCGNIILQKKIPIEEFDLQHTLYYRVMFESLKSLNKAINLVLSGYKGKKQNNKMGNYYSRTVPYDGRIKANWTESFVENYIRSMIFPPLKPAKFKGIEIYNLNDFKKVIKK